MTFKTECIESFKQIFSESRKLISSSEGCIHLDLMKDSQDENVFFTISKWNSEADLKQYKDSHIFENIWSKVKPLFSAKAEAWTLLNSD